MDQERLNQHYSDIENIVSRFEDTLERLQNVYLDQHSSVVIRQLCLAFANHFGALRDILVLRQRLSPVDMEQEISFNISCMVRISFRVETVSRFPVQLNQFDNIDYESEDEEL